MYRNIKDKVYLPYNGTYIAFLPEDFNCNKILNTKCYSKASCSGIYKLYDLETGEIVNFPSKTQFSLYFSNSRNDKLYDKYLNFIDENFLTAKKIKTLQDFLNSDIVIYRNKKTIKTCNIRIYLNALKNYSTNINLGKIINVSRRTVARMLNNKSINTRLKELENTIGHLSNLFKHWETSSQ